MSNSAKSTQMSILSKLHAVSREYNYEIFEKASASLVKSEWISI